MFYLFWYLSILNHIKVELHLRPKFSMFWICVLSHNNTFWKIQASSSKLSEELKNGINILLSKVVFELKR